MNQYIRLGFAIVLSIAIIAGTAAPAFAQTAETPAATTTTTAEPIKFEDICQRIKSRLNIRVGNVTDAKDENVTKYEGLNKRLEKVIAAAKEKGYSMTDLEAALVTTRAAIASYSSANKTYTTNLTATAGDACKSETGYKTSIEATRVSLKTAREAGLAARDAFQYSALPELRAYKVWLNEKANETVTQPEEEN